MPVAGTWFEFVHEPKTNENFFGSAAGASRFSCAGPRGSSARSHGRRVSPTAKSSIQPSNVIPRFGLWLPIDTRSFVAPAKSVLRPVPTSDSRAPSNAHSSTRPSASTPSCSCTHASFGTGTCTFTDVEVTPLPVIQNSRSEASLSLLLIRASCTRLPSALALRGEKLNRIQHSCSGRMSWFL